MDASSEIVEHNNGGGGDGGKSKEKKSDGQFAFRVTTGDAPRGKSKHMVSKQASPAITYW